MQLTIFAIEKDLFKFYKSFLDERTMTTANGDKVRALGKGTTTVESTVDKKNNVLDLIDAWCIPKIKNLFSVISA